MRTHIKIFVLALTCWYNTFSSKATGIPDSLISMGSLMQTVELLSSEHMAGRLPGHEGYNIAARVMALEFEKAGLQPIGHHLFFHDLKVEYNSVLPPCTFELHLDDGSVLKPRLGQDFTFRGFTGAGDIFTEVVFAGYGISVPEAGYDDYAGVDVKDKAVLVFSGNPRWRPEGQSWPGPTPREKSNIAALKGASAILFVAEPGSRAGRPEVIGSVMHGPGKQLTDFPQLVISTDLADLMLAGSGHKLESLRHFIAENRKPVSRSMNTQVRILVNTEYHEQVPTVNIIGMLEGSDPELKNEFIVLGAHLDHVGQQCHEVIFPGANDNASGSAAVLEMARAFNQAQFRPKRSIIFALFASEEQGLLGADHFVDNSPVPHEKIVAMLNFDCIAHGDSIQLGNGLSAPGLWELARQLDHKKLVIDRTWRGGGADLTPFYRAGIPGLYFVSTNSYTHLHSITDTPETLNQELFRKIVELGFRTAWKLAAGEYVREPVE